MSYRLNRFFSTFIFLIISTSICFAENIPNPVGYWSFDDLGLCDNAGVIDRTVKKNRGSIYGTLERIEGRYGYAGKFDNDLVEVKDIADYHMTGEVTLSAWVYPEKIDGLHTIISKWYAPGAYMLLIEHGKYTFVISTLKDGKVEEYRVSAPAKLKKWAHVTATFNHGEMRIYADGKLVMGRTQLPTTLRNSSRPLTIGHHPKTNAFIGGIDDVRIYNKALNRDQVATLAGSKPPVRRLCSIKGETGRIKEASNQWKIVKFKKKYSNPIVVATIADASRDKQRIHVKVRRVTSSGFEVKLSQWDYLGNQFTAKRDINFIVMNEGTHILSDGSLIEAGRSNVDHQWKKINLTGEFPRSPIILSQLQTQNGSSMTVPRLRNRGRSDFEVRLQEEQKNDDRHAIESVGYIAFMQGDHDAGDARFIVREMIDVTHKPQKISTSYFHNGGIFSALQSYEGGDPAHFSAWVEPLPVYPASMGKGNALIDASVVMKVVEETSADEEIDHTQELGGIVFFNSASGAFFYGYRAIGEVGKKRVDQRNRSTWHKVKLKNRYHQPVVFMQTMTVNGSDPATIRIRNVKNNQFEFQISEWEYLDGSHIKEEIHYLVVEAGRYTLLNGSSIEADVISHENSSWKSITYKKPFSSVPALFSQVQTFNEVDTVITRHWAANEEGFRLKLSEQENSNGRHASEKVGYIAMERVPARSLLGDGRSFQTGWHTASSTAPNKGWTHLNFGNEYPNPIFIASPYGHREEDPFSLRFKNLTKDKVDIFLQEEKSRDLEIFHDAEGVNFAVFDGSGSLYAGNGNYTALGTVNASGSSFNLSSGVIINFPANTVDQPTLLLQGEGQPVDLDGLDVVGETVEILPSDMYFKNEVCITLPFDVGRVMAKPSPYRDVSLSVVRKNSKTGKMFVLPPANPNFKISDGKITVCTHSLGTFTVVFSDVLSSSLMKIDQEPEKSLPEVCENLKDYVDTENEWGLGNHMYYFRGVGGSATLLAGQANASFDMVWDLYNQQFATFDSRGAGYHSSLLSLGADVHSGIAWGDNDNVLAAWGGYFLNANASVSPFKAMPFLGVGAGAFVSAKTSNIGTPSPDVPPDATFGFVGGGV